MTPTNALRHKPKLAYCGLTIVLSNPSRFDTQELISANAGAWFWTELRKLSDGKILRFHCDIRTSNTLNDGLLTGTKLILLLGQTALQEWTHGRYTELLPQRGSPIYDCFDIPAICSFTPQDACDVQNYEARLNENFRGSDEDSEDADDTDAKGHKGATSRQNFKFWLSQDLAKCVRFLSGNINRSKPPFVVTQPTATRVISELQSKTNDTLYLDIETLLTRELTCIGFRWTEGPTIVIPIRRYNGTYAYDTLTLCKILAALGGAMKRNLCVTHNGHGFDWLVLAHEYRVPFGRRLYDTIIAQNRCWPEAEKSLGHCLSLWTDEPYHKDEGVFDPKTREQEEQLWQYNAKDVWGMQLIKEAIDRESAKDAGLCASIAQGQAMIYPYLLATLKGMKADYEKWQKMLETNDRYLMQLLRIARILVGKENYEALQGKSKAGLMTSGKQAARYFYDILGYKCPHKTDAGEDAVDAKAMLKLGLWLARQEKFNPMIPLRLKFAEVKKETSTFANWVLWEKPYAPQYRESLHESFTGNLSEQQQGFDDEYFEANPTKRFIYERQKALYENPLVSNS